MSCEAPRDGIEQAICEAQEDVVLQAILQDVIEGTQWDLEIERQAEEHIQESIRYVGYEEWNHFLNYFNISWSSSNIVDEVRRIQRSLWVNDDWEVWPWTLRQLYIQEYANNYESLGTLQKWRYQAYRQVGADYPDWSRYVSEQGRVVNLRANEPNVFNRWYYLWNTEWEPINGGFINSSLRWRLPARENTQWVRWYLRRMDWDFVLSIYVNGELVLASFASPWNTARYWSEARTPQWNWSVEYLENRNVNTLTAEVNYISWGADSVRNSPNRDGSFTSDPMPFAVRVNRWVFTHAGNTTWGSESHGCIRLPLHYAMWVYEIFRMHGEIHWDTHYA